MTAHRVGIRMENVVDPVKPFVYSFHMRVPGYAQRTGKRLFLQPAFFQKGIAAMFSASTRKHGIYFHYSWTEDDTVTIDLPAGFALENAEAPQSFGARDVTIKPSLKIGPIGCFRLGDLCAFHVNISASHYWSSTKIAAASSMLAVTWHCGMLWRKTLP
jgi:hypothetical protein